VRRLDKTARTLGVFFNIHRCFPSACRSAEGTDCSIFIGFPRGRIDVLNQPAGLSPALHRLGPMWEAVTKRRGASQNRVRDEDAAASPATEVKLSFVGMT
jgi:hypothetical protein